MMEKSPQPPLLTVHDWACIRTELIWAYDHAVNPSYRVGGGTSEPGERVWYLRRGQVRVWSTEGNFEANAGQWLVLSKSHRRQEFSRDAAILSVHFFCQWPSGESLFANREGFIFPGGRYPELERKTTRLEQIIHRHFPDADVMYAKKGTDYGLFLRLQAVFLDWLVAWYRVLTENGARLTRSKLGDDRSLRAVRCLNEARMGGKFPREALRQETGLSEVHLTQLFLHDFGSTPRKYWDRRRLEYARVCLETGGMPVKELAYRLGFCSDSHFVAWFQRKVGRSPGLYRAQTVKESGNQCAHIR